MRVGCAWPLCGIGTRRPDRLQVVGAGQKRRLRLVDGMDEARNGSHSQEPRSDEPLVAGDHGIAGVLARDQQRMNDAMRSDRFDEQSETRRIARLRCRDLIDVDHADRLTAGLRSEVIHVMRVCAHTVPARQPFALGSRGLDCGFLGKVAV
jgi:hypothetical protein